MSEKVCDGQAIVSVDGNSEGSTPSGCTNTTAPFVNLFFDLNDNRLILDRENVEGPHVILTSKSFSFS